MPGVTLERKREKSIRYFGAVDMSCDYAFSIFLQTRYLDVL